MRWQCRAFYGMQKVKNLMTVKFFMESDMILSPYIQYDYFMPESCCLLLEK